MSQHLFHIRWFYGNQKGRILLNLSSHNYPFNDEIEHPVAMWLLNTSKITSIYFYIKKVHFLSCLAHIPYATSTHFSLLQESLFFSQVNNATQHPYLFSDVDTCP